MGRGIRRRRLFSMQLFLGKSRHYARWPISCLPVRNTHWTIPLSSLAAKLSTCNMLVLLLLRTGVSIKNSFLVLSGRQPPLQLNTINNRTTNYKNPSPLCKNYCNLLPLFVFFPLGAFRCVHSTSRG